jgi:hypothetical protein
VINADVCAYSLRFEYSCVCKSGNGYSMPGKLIRAVVKRTEQENVDETEQDSSLSEVIRREEIRKKEMLEKQRIAREKARELTDMAGPAPVTSATTTAMLGVTHTPATSAGPKPDTPVINAVNNILADVAATIAKGIDVQDANKALDDFSADPAAVVDGISVDEYNDLSAI